MDILEKLRLDDTELSQQAVTEIEQLRATHGTDARSLQAISRTTFYHRRHERLRRRCCDSARHPALGGPRHAATYAATFHIDQP